MKRRVLLAACLVFLLAGCGGAPSAPRATSKPTTQTVRFAVSGTTGTGLIALDTGSGQKNLGNQSLPWAHTAELRKGARLVLGAMANGTGSIVCGISVDGNVVTQEADSGKDAAVVCAWIVK